MVTVEIIWFISTAQQRCSNMYCFIFLDINEVAFIPDANLEAEILDGNHMSTAEYVTITICSILIGLIYVASVFFYLHLRKKNKSVHNEKGECIY